MYKVVILILSLVCGVRVGKAVEALPETTVASSFQLYQELGLRGEVNFPAFEQALKGFSRYASGQDRLLVLIDYTKPSTEKRFYILDLLQNILLLSTYVAHGRGSGDNYAVAFSNRPGSYQSSLGFYRTGDTYMGKNGYSLFLDGLDKGINDKARERAIVVHGANYAAPEVLKGQQRLGGDGRNSKAEDQHDHRNGDHGGQGFPALFPEDGFIPPHSFLPLLSSLPRQYHHLSKIHTIYIDMIIIT